MEIQIISKELFDKSKGNRGKRNIPQQGCIDGTYDDLLLFINWTLESNHNNNSERLMEAIEVLNEKYNMPFVTIQFLMNQMRKNFPNKTSRVRYLLNQSGMATENINRYFYNVIVSKMKLTMPDGSKRSYCVGHQYKRLEKQELDKIIDKEELDRKIADMKHRFEEEEKKIRERKPELEPKPEELPCVEMTCKKCNETIKIPQVNDSDPVLIQSIHSELINDIGNGIVFCMKCRLKAEQQGIWKTDEIMSFINENKGSCLGFTSKDFCDAFRNDKKQVTATTIKCKLENLDLIDVKIEVKAEIDVVKLKIE